MLRRDRVHNVPHFCIAASTEIRADKAVRAHAIYQPALNTARLDARATPAERSHLSATRPPSRTGERFFASCMLMLGVHAHYMHPPAR